MWLSGGIVLTMILFVATNSLPLLQASMSAVFALILTGCIPLTTALAAVNLRTVLTIVGAFGLGKAISITNVATVLAQGLVTLMDPLGSIGMLSAIFIATCLLGVVFHATAVVILLFPVCVSVANEMALPVHQCLGPLMVGAGCQFLTPISYQTNLMVYAAAGYDFSDFARLGFGLTIVIGVVAVPLCLTFL
ncbi:sodium/sulfate transporter, putative [Perkinsus marinus ATCC 50983]|nr:sodium/sulfate transporter, putative [Perkinsus marinus ATCC 50983]EER07119.1 sodium/sulfate transporter, putative [Perkinsus marinus ATCC 50983]|eukprot:XP_002775303.1 sodium/sulfate transporter, putative [Perkinsus marinus ATCC 50983]